MMTYRSVLAVLIVSAAFEVFFINYLQHQVWLSALTSSPHHTPRNSLIWCSDNEWQIDMFVCLIGIRNVFSFLSFFFFCEMRSRHHKRQLKLPIDLGRRSHLQDCRWCLPDGVTLGDGQLVMLLPARTLLLPNVMVVHIKCDGPVRSPSPTLDIYPSLVSVANFPST